MKKVFILLASICFSAGLFAQVTSEDLSKKTLFQANEAYDQGEYEEAYKKINMSLELTEDLDNAPATIIIARTIYKKILNDLMGTEDLVKVLEIENNLAKYPQVSNTELQLLIKQINTLAAIKSEDLSIQLVNKNTKMVQRLIMIVLIAMTFMILVIVGVIILVQLGIKKFQKQQEVYVSAIRNLADNQNRVHQLMLGGMTDLYGGMPTLQIGGQPVWEPALALPEVDISEEDQEAIKELAIKCEELGASIDEITGRKNNSKNVSEYVYKLSIKLGIPQGLAMLNFCAAMIYDAGFLSFDPTLLKSQSLSDAEREALKNHVLTGGKYLDFVPVKYRSVFEDAVTKHHENIDGTGYPKGLKGEAIPQIARLIRVSESFVSLSSKRNYRETLDKESAVEILKSQPQYYDKAVVEALDKLV